MVKRFGPGQSNGRGFFPSVATTNKSLAQINKSTSNNNQGSGFCNWYVRRIRQVVHALDCDEMIYHCDVPIGGRFDTLDAACDAAMAVHEPRKPRPKTGDKWAPGKRVVDAVT